MKKTFCLLLLAASFNIAAQNINIIPQPAEIKMGTGNFYIRPTTVIVVKNGVDDKAADFLISYFRQFYGMRLKKVKMAAYDAIRLTTLQTLVPGKEGAYSLYVSGKGINIEGQTASGTFYGMQTLIQLLPTLNIKSQISNTLTVPHLSVSDYPRFGYRGMHLDCGRHFWPVDFVKKYIDYLALHKFNTFHWHLTEDQGWRIEIKKYPKLTSVGGWRNGTIIGRYPGTGNDGIKYGGFYTQEQIKEIVKYAGDRFITVIPEIEMPGHSSAAIAAYPELSCFPKEPTIKYFPKQCKWNGDSSGKQVQQTWGVFDDVFCAGQENTFKFIQDVMDEILPLFPSKYIHVGGDECPKENWKRCPHCQQRIKDLKLKDEHELQSYFIQRMEKYLNSKGRTLIGWDEILEGGLAPNAVVMSWRGEQGGIDAARQNHDVIMTPGNPVYFDHTQSENEDSVTIGGYNPIEKVYAYEPVPKELNEEQAKHVLGAQANMWTEYMKNTRKVEYMLFPRISALSEVLWSKKENRDWDDFQKRLMGQFKRYDFWKVNYSKAYFDVKTSVIPSRNNDEVLLSIKSKSTSTYLHGEFLLPRAAGPSGLFKPVLLKDTIISVNQSGDYVYWVFDNPDYKKSQIFIFKEQVFHFNKATGKKITLTNPPSSKYPGDGAFTLVNGVQNEKGFARSKEFIGFEGTDCEAVIDLGEISTISSVQIHILDDKSRWIYPPSLVTVLFSDDGVNFSESKNEDRPKETPGEIQKIIPCGFYPSMKARYVKVVLKNYGLIPAGNPGAGHKAWLFVDEVEVK